MATFYPINTPLINYYFYPSPLAQSGANWPLSGGSLSFFDNADHSTMLPTYSDVSDPENPVVNPNPLPLGMAGECPLFYLEDKLYYIVIKDSTGQIIDTISNYNPANGTGSSTQVTTSTNFFANSQFTYGLLFAEGEPTDPNYGLCTAAETTVAWGWDFLQDEDTTTQNRITLSPIANEGIEGSPIYEIVLNSQSPQILEATKQFRSIIGAVNFMAGQAVTFSFQLISFLSSTTVNILLEQNFGNGGTFRDLVTIDSFTVTPTRQKFTTQPFTIPDISGTSVGSGNYVAIHIQGALGTNCFFGMTNAIGISGTDPNPTFIAQSYNDEKAQIVGNAMQLSVPDSTDNQDQFLGLDQNQSFWMYDQGQIYPYADTGTMVICPNTIAQPFRLKCDGSALSVGGYKNNIPNQRLYDVIGNTYGGSGDLIVTASNNVVTFKSADGAREKTTYSYGGGSAITIFQDPNTGLGLRLGVSAVIATSTTVQLTWIGNFAPSQTLPTNSPTGWAAPSLVGNYYLTQGVTNPPITVVVNNPGSGAAQAVATLTFSSNNPSDYMTNSKLGAINNIVAPRTCNFLEWATQDTNTQGVYPTTTGGFNLTAVLAFYYNGNINDPSGLNGIHANNVNLTSEDILSTIIQKAAAAINNPFIWTVTLNSIPPATTSSATALLFSSAGTDYYNYFIVDGSGSDPVIAGRTAIPVMLSSSQSLPSAAQAIATANNNLTFSLPQQSDLPTIPTAGSSWYINQ